jgi:hypothetical protein
LKERGEKRKLKGKRKEITESTKIKTSYPPHFALLLSNREKKWFLLFDQQSATSNDHCLDSLEQKHIVCLSIVSSEAESPFRS